MQPLPKMKKIILVLCIMSIGALAIYRHTNDPKSTLSLFDGNNKLPALHLKYRVYLFGIIPVAEATLENAKTEAYNGVMVYRLRATAKSMRYLSPFFYFSAVLDSYVNKETMNAMKFRERITIPGKKHIDKEIVYDQNAGVMVSDSVQRVIVVPTQDPLAAVFNIMRMDFNKNATFKMNLNTNQKNYDFTGKTKAYGLSSNNKLFKMILAEAEIKRASKNPYHRSMVTLILLQEQENVPVICRIFAGGFVIVAKLVGLQYE